MLDLRDREHLTIDELMRIGEPVQVAERHMRYVAGQLDPFLDERMPLPDTITLPSPCSSLDASPTVIRYFAVQAPFS